MEGYFDEERSWKGEALQNRLESFFAYRGLYESYFEFFFSNLGRIANERGQTLVEYLDDNGFTKELALLQEHDSSKLASKPQPTSDLAEAYLRKLENSSRGLEIRAPKITVKHDLEGYNTLAAIRPKFQEKFLACLP